MQLHFWGKRGVVWVMKESLTMNLDNKVLPMQLTPEQARSEPKWWYDPR